LLAFFPLAFSGTCTAQLCELRDDDARFVERGVTVFPISVDSTYSLKEYKAKYAMKVDLLSDFKRDVSRLYGVLLDERFYSKRAYFLLGPDGVIRWKHVEENPSHRRSDSELLAAIDGLTPDQ
jgi:peroxiredoxin